MLQKPWRFSLWISYETRTRQKCLICQRQWRKYIVCHVCRSYRYCVCFTSFFNDLVQPEKSWEVDLEHMASLIDERTKAIVVVNPSNPCGSNFSREHILDILSGTEVVTRAGKETAQLLLFYCKWSSEKPNVILRFDCSCSCTLQSNERGRAWHFALNILLFKFALRLFALA